MSQIVRAALLCALLNNVTMEEDMTLLKTCAALHDYKVCAAWWSKGEEGGGERARAWKTKVA